MFFDKDQRSNAWEKLNFESYKKQRNVYLASAVIVGTLFFMLGSGVYISHNISGGSSLEMAIDKRIDACWKEKGLE